MNDGRSFISRLPVRNIYNMTFLFRKEIHSEQEL